MKKTPPEVLIYVQSIKKFFTTNEDARKYFEIENLDSLFFKHLIELSHKNFEDNGEPELSLLQFEELRKKMSKTFDSYGIFISLGEYGLVSLN